MSTLPTQIVNVNSVTAFKSWLKSHFFTLAFDWHTLPTNHRQRL